METINLRVLNRMMLDAKVISNAEDNINNVICSGQYVAIELSNGSVLRLDKPIKIHSIDIIGEEGRWNLNEPNN